MAKRGKRRASGATANRKPEVARQPEAARQPEIDRQQWMRRRKRNTILGLLLGIVAIAGSLGYSIHNAIGRIDTSIASELGPTTADRPVAALGNFKRLNVVLRQGSKPQALMIDRLQCNTCAAERWALVKALGRFGTWSDLKSSTNGSGIPTFNLVDSSYSSWYVSLVHKDIKDAGGNRSQILTQREVGLFNRY